MRLVMAWAGAALSIGLIAAAIALTVAPGSGAPELSLDTLLFALQFVPLAVVGALIAARRPAHRIGWLLVSMGLIFGLGGAITTAARFAYAPAPGLGAALVIVSNQLFKLVFCGGVVLMLWFPTGRLPSAGWRWVQVALALLVATAMLAEVVAPGPVVDYLVAQPPVNPWGIETLAPVVHVISRVGFAVLGLLAAAAVVSLINRFRHASTDVRLQLKWFALASSIWAATLVADGVYRAVWTGPTWPQLPFQIVYSFGTTAMAAGIGVAILRHRWLDVDVVISRTLTYTLLMASITVFYLVVVAGVGAIFVLSSSSQLVLAVCATAIVAVAFQPLRARLEHLARRLVYGARTGPYEILAEFTRRLEAVPDLHDVLPSMVRMLAVGTGSDAATVWVTREGRATPLATWPGPEPVISGATTRSVPVLHAGERLGELTVMRRSGERLSPTEEDLMDSLARQAGLVLRNERLQQELRQRIDELRASRERVVSLRDEERRRLERDLHDGAQQDLVALRMKLGLASATARSDPTRVAPLLDELQSDLGLALESLRELARGVYPPLLEAEGLRAALTARSRSLPFAVDIQCDERRYPRDIEVAIYFCCTEALQNIVKHAGATCVRICVNSDPEGAGVRFEVSDNGRGGRVNGLDQSGGLQHIRDRIEALSGATQIESTIGVGSRVVGYVPLPRLT